MTASSVVERALVGVPRELREFLSASSGGAGVLCASSNTVAYTDTTAKNLFVIPANALLLGLWVNVTTVFNDSGTDLLDIGKTGTAQQYRASGLDVSALGQTLTGWRNLGLLSSSADTQIIGTYTGQNADPTTGAARVTALWLPA